MYFTGSLTAPNSLPCGGRWEEDNPSKLGGRLRGEHEANSPASLRTYGKGSSNDRGTVNARRTEATKGGRDQLHVKQATRGRSVYRKYRTSSNQSDMFQHAVY